MISYFCLNLKDSRKKIYLYIEDDSNYLQIFLHLKILPFSFENIYKKRK